MRIVLLFAFTIISFSSYSQAKEFFATDTAAIAVMFDGSAIIPDTSFRLKKSTVAADSYVIWYDRSRKQKCVDHTPEVDTTWYRNGQVNTVMKANLTDSTSYAAWHSDGKRKIRTTFRGDSIIIDHYYNNKQLANKEVSYKGRFVYYEKWCENGQLIAKLHFDLTKLSMVTHYHCNGNKKVEYLGGNGTATGKWIKWYENGNIEVEGYFPERTDKDLEKGPLPFPLETGTWKYYNENGTLKREVTYDNGKVLKTIEY